MVVSCEGSAGSLDGELLGGGHAFGVAVTDPSEDFVLELLLIGNAAIKTLLGKNGELDLSWAKRHLPGLSATLYEGG